MPAKRAAVRPPSTGGTASTSPVVNAALVGLAASYGLWLLVSRGRVSWPPTDLITNTYTIAGCMALVGPMVLMRREGGESGVGDILWLTGGILTWVFNLAALAKGEARLAGIATPISSATMGLILGAVLVAAWRTRGGSKSWSWTNVTGWMLGVFWIGLSLLALLPPGMSRLAIR